MGVFVVIAVRENYISYQEEQRTAQIRTVYRGPIPLHPTKDVHVYNSGGAAVNVVNGRILFTNNGNGHLTHPEMISFDIRHVE